MPRVCVASHHTTLLDLLDDAEFSEIAHRNNLLIELRLDQYLDLTEKALLRAIRRFRPERLVVTYRNPDEGGARADVTDEQRLLYVLAAIRAGVAFLDIELGTLRRSPDIRRQMLAERGSAAKPLFIYSFHDFEKTPAYSILRDTRKEMEALGADVSKIAVKPRNYAQALPLLELMAEEVSWTRPLIALAMGEEGVWSRVLGPLFPHCGPFTFARGEGAPGTAPGQPSWRELVQTYRFPQLDADWLACGYLSDVISGAKAPLIHNEAMAASNLKGVMAPFRIAGDPTPFLRKFVPLLKLPFAVLEAGYAKAIRSAYPDLLTNGIVDHDGVFVRFGGEAGADVKDDRCAEIMRLLRS